MKRAFHTLSELLYWSYANLQMMDAATAMGLKEYNRTCYMIRSKAYKAYCEGRWKMHDLLQENISKMRSDNSCCAYCGKKYTANELSIEHIFPKAKGGSNSMNNLLLVCRTCNSNKGDTDLMKWYTEVRHEFPPRFVLIHYLKQAYAYAEQNNLLNTELTALDELDLPFEYHWIPLSYPNPS